MYLTCSRNLSWRQAKLECGSYPEDRWQLLLVLKNGAKSGRGMANLRPSETIIGSVSLN